MRVQLSPLRHGNDYRVALRKDGWLVLGADSAECIEVIHPEVADQSAARARLDRLGLLTSPFLRIRFDAAVAPTKEFQGIS